MRTAVLALLILVGVCQQGTAQTAWADKLFGKNPKDLICEFGVVPHGAQLKHSFTVHNIYSVPLEITNIRVECGCVTTKESTKILKPDEYGTLDVNMDSSRFSGRKTVKIFVSVGPEYVSTATLTVQANARLDVVFNPGEIDFGLVHHGESPTKFIDVEYAGALPWVVSEIFKGPSAPFDLKAEVLQNRGTRGYRIYATVKPNAPAGTFKQEIILKTNDPASPTLTFNILGNIQPTLKVAPGSIEVADVKIGEVVKRKVVVRGSRPFRIVGVDGQGDGVTAVVPENEAATQIVEIHVNPAKTGELKKQLLIRTDLDNETVTVTVHGNGT